MQIWPRFHQLDVVRKLLADTGRHGAGKRYLIQHSAGERQVELDCLARAPVDRPCQKGKPQGLPLPVPHPMRRRLP